MNKFGVFIFGWGTLRPNGVILTEKDLERELKEIGRVIHLPGKMEDEQSGKIQLKGGNTVHYMIFRL